MLDWVVEMLKMTISDWKARIDKQFLAGLSNVVVIGGNKKTSEITNFEFCLTPEKIEVYDFVDPPVKEEITERKFVCDISYKMYDEYLKKDLNSRQAAFVNNYDGADNHCISYFHHYIRNKKYCMNVYVRSMDYKRNFVYDCQTFNLAYLEVFTELKEQYDEKVEKGYIRVFVFSLHVYT